jgi:hypothetical protein
MENRKSENANSEITNIFDINGVSHSQTLRTRQAGLCNASAALHTTP